MTDKEQIICKYKFQDKEKFSGKPYCTCFNELCEDLSFVCDHNCQIYEDYKQLARKTQECEELKEKLAAQENINNHIADYQVSTSKILDRYRKALEEIEKVLSHCIMTGAIVKILTIINKAKGE